MKKKNSSFFDQEENVFFYLLEKKRKRNVLFVPANFAKNYTSTNENKANSLSVL